MMDDNKSLLERYSFCIEGIDPHNKIAGFSRSILAIGTLLTFIFTPMGALFYQSNNYPEGVVCSGNYSAFSLFCVMPPHSTPWAYIIVYLILGSVINHWSVPLFDQSATFLGGLEFRHIFSRN